MAFWPLNSESLLTDVSLNENHGIKGDDATLVADADGTFNGAYQFTGTAKSYIELPNNGAFDLLNCALSKPPDTPRKSYIGF